MVVVGVRLVCVTMFIFYFTFFLQRMFLPPKLLGNVLPAKVKVSMIIINSIIPGIKNVSGVSEQNECCDLQDSP